ncbi:hypothetical protein [Parafrankia discariae]|uniref:hypothetical protein n=1 Tax=Parafrankia discariae TaxID=365528 RepID=UPI001E5E9E08|nr:hypothetical protein [Parafrankia discariae]
MPGPGPGASAQPRVASGALPRWSLGRTAVAGVIALGLAVGAAAAVNASSLGSDGAGGGAGGARGGPFQLMNPAGSAVTGGVGTGSLHGEFVTADRSGGYTTVRTQSGAVTTVQPTAVTVRSTDGFTATYTVTDETLVDGRTGGIDNVDVGDTVGVTATVPDDNPADGTTSTAAATATAIIEETTGQSQGQNQNQNQGQGQGGQGQLPNGAGGPMGGGGLNGGTFPGSQPGQGAPSGQGTGSTSGVAPTSRGGAPVPPPPGMAGPVARQTALVPSAIRLEGGRGGTETGTAVATAA